MNKENEIFELDEHVLSGGLGGVNMGFGIPTNAYLGLGVKPYMDFINADAKLFEMSSDE